MIRAALGRAQPLGDRPDAARPTGGLYQAVEEHEDQERGERVGEPEDHVEHDRERQPAQQQDARPPRRPMKLLMNMPSM